MSMSTIFTFILLLLHVCSGYDHKGQDINECTNGADDCVFGALCVNTDGSFTCICPSGFTGDGRESGSGCTDINECTSGTDDCVDGACDNTPLGSFTCTCPSGFTGDGRDSPGGSGCTDINECTRGTDDCVDDATCVNIVGSFTCTCPSGFTGHGRDIWNGCTDVDECTEDTHSCANGYNCVNIPGSFRCNDINECTSGPDDCVDDATCVNTPPGSFTCTCPSGFTGDGRDSGSGCIDINECEGPSHCGTGATCINRQGSFTCQDINECTSGADDCVDGATCVNTDGSFTCTCPSGFTGDGRESGSGCRDINECSDGSHNCGDGTTCVNTQGSFICADINECTSGADDCVDGATCVNTDGSFTCTCPFGFSGDGRDSGSGCTDNPVQLIFQAVSYPDNSELFIGDIGDTSTGSAILCTTNKSPCCSTPPNRFGEWRYPNGSVVHNNAAGEDFFRGRTNEQSIRLSRRNNGQSPTGSFCCELPDANDVTHRLCVNIIKPITMATIEIPTTRLENGITGGVNNGSRGDFSIVVGVSFGLVVIILSVVVAVSVIVCVAWRRHSTRNKNKDTSFNMAPNTSYGPVKSSNEMVESEYEDMKTGNQVYEEIPPATVTFDLASNVAYGPIQRESTAVQVTTPAAATAENQYEVL